MEIEMRAKQRSEERGMADVPWGITRWSVPVCHRGSDGISHVPEEPLEPLPCSSTPAGLSASGLLRCASAVPADTTTRTPTRDFRGSITRLQFWLSALRRAGYPATTQDSLPAAGQALPGGILTPWVPLKGFQAASYISSSFLKLRGAMCLSSSS